MPPKKQSRRRDGEKARGGARINMLASEVPNTSSEEYSAKFAGARPEGVPACSCLLRPEQRLGGGGAKPLTLKTVAAERKRPASARDGAGSSGGKTTRTLLRREVQMEDLFMKETARRANCGFYEYKALIVLENIECRLKPEAERLGYDYIRLYDKYVAVRLFFSARSLGYSAVAAAEEAARAAGTGGAERAARSRAGERCGAAILV